MATGNTALIEQLRTCGTELYNSPEAAVLRQHSPSDAREATLSQLADQSLPTRQEIASIMAVHARAQTCRKALLDGLVNTTPTVVPVLAKAFAAAEDDTIAFAQRRISWGERTRRSRDRIIALQAAIQGEEGRIVSGLEQSHQAELARRQEALNALSQWAQTQQMINAMNRPVFTNCSRVGSFTNCVSQ